MKKIPKIFKYNSFAFFYSNVSFANALEKMILLGSENMQIGKAYCDNGFVNNIETLKIKLFLNKKEYILFIQQNPRDNSRLLNILLKRFKKLNQIKTTI